MSLNLLSDTQIANYIASLDLAESTEAYRTMNAMLLLPPATFARAISAMAQNLVSLPAFRTLPAMNATLVEALIAHRLGSEDLAARAWRYRTELLPASIDVSRLRDQSVGNAQAYLTAKFTDRWGGIIRPQYDFVGTNASAYHTYIEAYSAYMVIASSSSATAVLAEFRARDNELARLFPAFFSDTVVRQLIESLQMLPVLLEQQSGGRVSNPLLDWIVSGTWRSVEPGNYARFMDEDAYPAMAERMNFDADLTGISGAAVLVNQVNWLRLNESDLGWTLDRARMARIQLPSAYGNLIRNTAELDEDRNFNSTVISWLETARSAILAFFDVVSTEMSLPATKYRAPIGSGLGLLLTLTHS